MRTNGYIRGKVATMPPRGQAVFDEDGNPIFEDNSVETEWTDPIDCWVQIDNDDAGASYENGEYRRLSLTVLMDTDSFDANIVRVERDGEDLGEFRVIQKPILRTMGRVRLTLRQ